MAKRGEYDRGEEAWPPDRVEFLRANFVDMTDGEMAARLTAITGRTYSLAAVKLRRIKEGLRKK